MKATGCVRRVDDLGRVVIPKEVRKNLLIKEGDPLEIYIDDGSVVFKRYDYSDNAMDAIKNLKRFLEIDDCTCQTELLKKVREMEEILKKAGANND